MDTINIEKLKQINIDISEQQKSLFNLYFNLFLEENSKLNLISKNDEKFLFEKHIYDSLAINMFFKPKAGQTLLDIGTGGGFPAVPISIMYNNLQVYALDSIKKKINSIETIKTQLQIQNLFTICDRVENIEQKFDYITSRAVATLDVILRYAIPKLKKDGYFIAYKSKRALKEIDEAQKTIKNLNVKIIDIIEYTLPMDEIFERNLIIFAKNK